MGKKLHQQRRGKGSNVYTKLPGTFDISVGYPTPSQSDRMGEVVEFINHTGHTAPLMKILYDDMNEGYLLAPEGVKTGDRVQVTGAQQVYPRKRCQDRRRSGRGTNIQHRVKTGRRR